MAPLDFLSLFVSFCLFLAGVCVCARARVRARVSIVKDMEARAFRAAVASLSSAALRRLCSNKSGKHWQTLMGAFQDCDVDGAMISDCVDSVDSLHVLLRDQLGLELPKMIAVALHQILAKHTANQAQQDSKTRPHAKESDQVKAAPAAYSATPAEPGTPTTTAIHLRSGSRRYARVSLCVNVQEWGQPPVKIMLDICAQAKVATVQRVLLERMQKSLTTHAHLAHAGVPIYPSSAPPNWASLSFIHAVISNDPSNLTLANAAHHPLVVEGGCVDCSDLSLELPTKQLLPPILRIFDSAAIIGNGAFGLVYQGSLDDVHSQRPVAVKKFFMLENPSLYGLCDKTKVHAWINRELLPEINILARLTHPNVVRLRCVGLQDVFGVAVPGCIAMDLCDGGTLEKWIRFENVTDVCTVHFIRDLVAGMHYLHHQAQIVHRDLKPDNLFIKLSFRPTLVIGDVGCSKQADRALSLVSAAGAVAYRAPEALGGLASFASDVFSASLVAIELVTGKGVFEESNGDETKKQALVDEAQQTMECILSFADDSDLNIEAVDLLLRACTIADPTNRPTFQLIEAKCARGPADYLPMLPSTTTKASRQGGSAKHRDMQTKAETPDHKGMPEPEAEADAQARATAISNSKTLFAP